MGTIRYVLRTDQPNKNGSCQIRLVYQIKGNRKYFVAGQSVFKENWDDQNQVAVYLDRKTSKQLLPAMNYNLLPSAKEIEAINNKLTEIRIEIREIENHYNFKKIVYSAEMVIATLKENQAPETKKDAPANLLFDFIDKYIADHSETREKSSLAVYKTLKNHLQAFLVAICCIYGYLVIIWKTGWDIHDIFSFTWYAESLRRFPMYLRIIFSGKTI